MYSNCFLGKRACSALVVMRRARVLRTAMLLAFAAATFGLSEEVAVGGIVCDTNGLNVDPTITPATAVTYGDEVCIRFTVSNLTTGSCQITGLSLVATLPDTSTGPTLVTIVDNATIEQGESFVCPGADARCATASNCTLDADGTPGGLLVAGYKYIVNRDDEHGATGTSCPPTPASGRGFVHATVVNTDGTVHFPDGNVGVEFCKPVTITVRRCGDNSVNRFFCTNDTANQCVSDIGCPTDAANNCTLPNETCDGSAAGSLGCSAGTSGALDACRAPDGTDECTCCGDGVIQASSGEACDGAATGNCAGGCDENCRCLPFCGDGIVNGNEYCDDGNTNNNDACRNDCTACGDLIVNGGEYCDGTTGCRQDCTACGDGIVNGGEYCDGTAGCRADCTACGDGIVNGGEFCDGTTGCRQDCTACGDGVVQTGEYCDGTVGCRTDCTACGDGIVNGGESCDDGNNVSGDGCSATCEPENEETCRTPGFWGTHACGANGTPAGTTGGCEKSNSKNVTLAALNACGGCAEVCGDIIDTTILNDSDSALEAICVSIKGTQVRQLARQLTSAALNCCISGSSASCGGISIEPLFTGCNAACAAGSHTFGGVNCINAIDCFNNGGNFNTATGQCTFEEINCHTRNVGLCSNGAICTDQVPCASGSCRPHGPAGSSNACSASTGNSCYVIGGSVCSDGTNNNGSQFCED